MVLVHGDLVALGKPLGSCTMKALAYLLCSDVYTDFPLLSAARTGKLAHARALEAAPDCLRALVLRKLQGGHVDAFALARDRRQPPGFIRPCQPILAAKVPAGDGWLHELKHDGFRIIVHVFEPGIGVPFSHP